MSLFDLNPSADQNLMDQARLNPIQPDQLAPAWYAGTWKAPVTGLASAWNDAALLLGDAGTPIARSIARPVDKLFGTDLDSWLTQQQQIPAKNIADWAPDARTTGWLGQAVHGLFNVVPEAVAGGPETAAVLQGYKGMRRGQMEGLNDQTALGMGAIDAVSTWVGLKLPMQAFPKWGAAGAVATGAGGNAVTGAISRGAAGEWLRQNGYPDMAAQYKVLDTQAIAIDLLMGGGFGALAHYGPGAAEKYQAWRDKKAGEITPADVDAAMAMNNQLHIETDTAPGIPTTPDARAAHVDAVNHALEALMRDDPVIVSPEVTSVDFLENPQADAVREQVGRAIEEHLDQIDPGWRALKVELEKRGLPTDELEGTEIVRTRRTSDVSVKLNDRGDYLEAKSENGQVSGVVRDGALKINFAEVSENMRGKGEGTKLYQALIDDAHARGLRVFSDSTVEADAARVYESLKRRGYDVRDMSAGTLEGGAKYGKGATEPAFEVVSQSGSMQIPSEAGKPIAAQDALAHADAEIASAERDAPGYDAAIACMLRG